MLTFFDCLSFSPSITSIPFLGLLVVSISERWDVVSLDSAYSYSSRGDIDRELISPLISLHNLNFIFLSLSHPRLDSLLTPYFYDNQSSATSVNPEESSEPTLTTVLLPPSSVPSTSPSETVTSVDWSRRSFTTPDGELREEIGQRRGN